MAKRLTNREARRSKREKHHTRQRSSTATHPTTASNTDPLSTPDQTPPAPKPKPTFQQIPPENWRELSLGDIVRVTSHADASGRPERARGTVSSISGAAFTIAYFTSGYEYTVELPQPGFTIVLLERRM
jgi:hypothetical protein